jgi:hypothetical protein
MTRKSIARQPDVREYSSAAATNRRPEARPLAAGIDRQQPQIASLAERLDKDASGQTRRILRQQERRLFQEFANTLSIDAVAVKGDSLDDESCVDQPNDRSDITLLRNSRANTFRRERICSGTHKASQQANQLHCAHSVARTLPRF